MIDPSEVYTQLDQAHPDLAAELAAARSKLQDLSSRHHPILNAWPQTPALQVLSLAADDCYRSFVDRHNNLILLDSDVAYQNTLRPWRDAGTASSIYNDIYMAAAFTHYAPDEPTAAADPLRATYAALVDLVATYDALSPLSQELLLCLLPTWHATLPDLIATTDTLNSPALA